MRAATTTVTAPVQTGVSNGKTYTVAITSIDGSTTVGQGGDWHAQVGQLSGGDPAVTEAFNKASQSVAGKQIDEAQQSNAKNPYRWKFESASLVTFSKIAIGQLISGTNYAGAHRVTAIEITAVHAQNARRGSVGASDSCTTTR